MNPKVRVAVTPQKIDKGQMIVVSAQIYDFISNRPMVFERIYLEIINSKGVAVWPLTAVETDSDHIDKLISTAEMNSGRYTIRVSPSKKLSPMGYAFFEIKPTLAAIILPLIPLAVLAVPKSPPASKIAYLTYRTEKDSRVCPICLPHEGKVFKPTDPNLIRIGPPQLGGETHFNCRCNYDITTYEQLGKYEKAAQISQIANIAQIALTSNETM